MPAPVLWHFAISHFTEKARWALDYKQVPHVRKLLFLEYPLRCGLRTGQLRLPVLFHAGRTIRDSTRIIEAVEEAWPEPPLYPADPEERRRALALEDFFDEELGPHLRAIVVDALFRKGARITAEAFGMGQGERARRLVRALFPIFRGFYRARHHMLQRESIERGRRKVELAIERLERELGPGAYLVGDRFSVADLTAAALFYPIAQPPEDPYPYPPAARELIGELLEPWRDTRARQWVTETYRRHRGASAALPGST